MQQEEKRLILEFMEGTLEYIMYDGILTVDKDISALYSIMKKIMEDFEKTGK